MSYASKKATYTSQQDRASLKKFETFRAAFAHSKVSKLALKSNALSTVNPTPYLIEAYAKTPTVVDDLSNLPRHLRNIVKMQDQHGRWSYSNALCKLMGGLLPEPPHDVSSNIWYTSLVLVFIRQYPEYINELGECYKLGLSHTNRKLMDEAREGLPPFDRYYEVDEEMGKKGMWKESVRESFVNGGYQNFLTKKTREGRIKVAEDTRNDELELEARIKIDEETRKLAEVGVHVNTEKVRLKNKKLQCLEKNARADREKQYAKIERKRQPLLKLEYSTLVKSGDFGELSKRWSDQCSLTDEMKRLNVIISDKNSKPSWDRCAGVVDKAVAKRNEIGGSLNRGPSESSIATKNKARELLYERIALKNDANKVVLTPLEKALSAYPSSRLLDSHSHSQLHSQSEPDVVEQSSNAVIEAIMKYEQEMMRLKSILKKTILAYKSAREISARQSSFDEVTAILGEFQFGRRGYTDWREVGVNGLINLACDVIESVSKWRIEVLRSEGKLGLFNEYNEPIVNTEPPKPFIWNNLNMLRTMPSRLNFLSECTELVNWYGPDFKFTRNPFMLAVPLDARPTTPIKDTRIMLVNGEKVEQYSELLGRTSEAQKEYLEVCEGIEAGAGKWWPCEGGMALSKELKRRVRECEKILIEEERVM